jgi:hypothetical protein
MKKLVFTVALLTVISGAAIARHNNNPYSTNGTPGNDSVTPKEGHIKPAVQAPKTPVAPAQKPKPVAPAVKKDNSYELKAPSIFTFTVLNTYFNMPIKKK